MTKQSRVLIVSSVIVVVVATIIGWKAYQQFVWRRNAEQEAAVWNWYDETPREVNAQSGTKNTNSIKANTNDSVTEEKTVVFPIAGYVNRRTFKTFGEYISDRFTGYHAADDIEVDDVSEEVPVYAIANGSIVYASRVSGYGGLLIAEYPIEGITYRALYGHVDLASVQHGVGDAVKKGEQLAVLGDDKSTETDGERKHLHFGLYIGTDTRFAGYVNAESDLGSWINPQNFFSSFGLTLDAHRSYDPARDLGGSSFHLAFNIPDGMEIEYIPSLDALNVFSLSGTGSARDRSQLLIRYFDSNRFETLTTVNVESTTDTTVGTEDYTAKQYVIEKKSGVANFADQPDWRNGKHTVTDFRGAEGRTRYYVVAANPALDTQTYQAILDSMTINE